MLMFVKSEEQKDVDGLEVVSNEDESKVYLGLDGVIYGDPGKLDAKVERLERMKALKSAKGTDTIKLVRDLGTNRSKLAPYLFKLISEDDSTDKQKFVSNLKAGLYEGKREDKVQIKEEELADKGIREKLENKDNLYEEEEEEAKKLFGNLGDTTPFKTVGKLEVDKGLLDPPEKITDYVEEEETSNLRPHTKERGIEVDSKLDAESSLLDPPEKIIDNGEVEHKHPTNEEELCGEDLEDFKEELMLGMKEAAAAGEGAERSRNTELNTIKILNLLDKDVTPEIDLEGVLENISTSQTILSKDVKEVKDLIKNQECFTEIIEKINILVNGSKEKQTVNLSDNDYQSITDVVNDVIRGAFEDFGREQNTVEEPKLNIAQTELSTKNFVEISKYRQSDHIMKFIAQSTKQGKMSLDPSVLNTGQETKGISSLESTLPLLEDLLQGKDLIEFLQFIAMHYQFTMLEFEQFRRDLND